MPVMRSANGESAGTVAAVAGALARMVNGALAGTLTETVVWLLSFQVALMANCTE
jgi:hypothetical protein